MYESVKIVAPIQTIGRPVVGGAFSSCSTSGESGCDGAVEGVVVAAEAGVDAGPVVAGTGMDAGPVVVAGTASARAPDALVTPARPATSATRHASPLPFALELHMDPRPDDVHRP